MLPFDEINSKIQKKVDNLFCTASRLRKKDHLERMIAGGLDVISCGANVPFADKKYSLVASENLQMKE